MILVPQYKKCRAISADTDDAARSNERSVPSVAGNLETGTDSPDLRQQLALNPSK